MSVSHEGPVDPEPSGWLGRTKQKLGYGAGARQPSLYDAVGRVAGGKSVDFAPEPRMRSAPFLAEVQQFRRSNKGTNQGIRNGQVRECTATLTVRQRKVFYRP